MSERISDELFHDFPISKAIHIAIVIPVRNETETIEKTLESLTKQVNFNGARLKYTEFEILILANNCTDDSADIIKKFQRKNPELNLHLAEISLSGENANIGFVRRTLMNAALARLRKNEFGGGVLMTTDGDTIVANDWIAFCGLDTTAAEMENIENILKLKKGVNF